MNLLGVRQQFVKLSGRYDLATTDAEDHDEDNGADFFINSGQRFLDQRFYTEKTIGRRFDEVAADTWYLTFQNCRSVQAVWCNDDESRWQLRKYDYDTIRRNYSGLISEIDTGSPKYYCPVWIRSIDATDIDAQGQFANYVKTDDDGTYNGVLWMPPTDDSYVIEVIGHFYSTELSGNTIESFWSVRHPETLLKAALYQLEVFYRNTEGAKDWLGAITAEASDVEKDVIEQESAEEWVRE